jgi:hypothetical protein
MFSAHRLTTLIAATTAALVLLAGCSSPLNLDIAVDTDGTPTVPVEAVTDEPVVDIATLSSGDKLTKQQALDINRDFTTGVRGYQMADESWVAILKESPLPPAVAAEIAVEVTGLANTAPPGDSSAIRNALGNAQYKTSKAFIAVAPVLTGCPPDRFAGPSWVYGVAISSRLVKVCMTKDEALAFAQSMLAEKADASRWEVIVG